MGAPSRIEQQRLAFEARADALFDDAWRGVRQLSAPFKFDLDLYREPSGRWRDFFAETPFRPLDLPSLLLDDLSATETPERARIEAELLDAAALSAAAVLALEAVLESEASYTFEHSLLPSGLIASAEWRLAAATRRHDHVRSVSLAHWNEASDAMLTHRTTRVGRCRAFDARDVAQMGKRWAPLKTPLVVALELAGRSDLEGALLPLLDEAAALFQLARELGRVVRDLARGACTYPVSCLVGAMGSLENPASPPSADIAMLGAALTPALPRLVAESLSRVERVLEAVEALGLARVRRALEPLAGPFREMRLLQRADAPAPDASGGETAIFTLSARPQIEQVVRAARGYLRSDPTYREAWEENRWDFLNVPDLTCTVFPTGLILENRTAADEDCAEEIEQLFGRYVKNHFHYYDASSSLPPDCDTLGLMLRLSAHARSPERCRELLAEPLGWLASNVETDGGFPVFMTKNVRAPDNRRYAAVAGRRCAAVQAGLLLGLLTAGFGPARELAAGAARALFASVARSGATSFWFYDVPLGVSLVLELAERARHAGIGGVEADAAEETCLGLVRTQSAIGRVSPQDAALLHWATRFERARPLRDPSWMEVLLRTQRHDGTWDACPLYVIPTRGNLMNWYGSRLVTTSYAYRSVVHA